MKTLYVLRHGQAAPEAEAGSDHQRALTRRGQAEAQRAADCLKERSRVPTLILTSSAIRARQTAELCQAALPVETKLVVSEGLYLAEPPSYLAALALRGESHDALLVVGHNPGLEALIYVLTQHSEHLATASLVEIELPVSTWSELSTHDSAASRGLSPKGHEGGRVVHAFRA